MKDCIINIVMPAYNHEKFIGKAIESVLMQESPYPFKLIIGDDCSTDGTRKICEAYQSKYPSKIALLPAEKNIGIISNYERLFNSCDAPYIAILEGDDYWITSNKLQQQVVILEKNSTIGLVHTNALTLYENGQTKTTHLGNKEKLSGAVLGKSQIIDIVISPLTVCFRKALLQYIDFSIIRNCKLSTVDFVLWTEFAHHCRFAFINEVTGVYRVLNSSISNTTDIKKIESFHQLSILDYFFNKFKVPEKYQQPVYNKQHYFMMCQYLERGLFEQAREKAQNIKGVTTNTQKLFVFVAKYPSVHFLFTFHRLLFKLLSSLKQKLVC